MVAAVSKQYRGQGYLMRGRFIISASPNLFDPSSPRFFLLRISLLVAGRNVFLFCLRWRFRRRRLTGIEPEQQLATKDRCGDWAGRRRAYASRTVRPWASAITKSFKTVCAARSKDCGHSLRDMRIRPRPQSRFLVGEFSGLRVGGADSAGHERDWGGDGIGAAARGFERGA